MKEICPKNGKISSREMNFFSIFLNREINFLTLVLLSLMDLQRWVLKWNEILLWLVFVNFCLFITGNVKIWTSKGDENLVRITGSSNNWKLSFPSNFQLFNGLFWSNWGFVAQYSIINTTNSKWQAKEITNFGDDNCLRILC